MYRNARDLELHSSNLPKAHRNKTGKSSNWPSSYLTVTDVEPTVYDNEEKRVGSQQTHQFQLIQVSLLFRTTTHIITGLAGRIQGPIS